ncbi:sigma-54-dependent transcriptional regulator [Nannocystis punicea]|uniref:Sigma-54 dependent transcriptional regulator n=1 Tax=Nannocystis punicea TaxID=2995304 RepID=A0ABY7HJF7_9BACT|nr:sigma-54 dependent transcriptional regulator [Nannocystis poenicansa]WAS99024.1 sigma-54 dependent transcriptional regulator [Nannocystis poenicansa]
MQQVLIVDDNPSVCTALEILFDVHGMSTQIAHTPQAALEIIARGDVGAVVQDMNFQTDSTSGQEGAALFREIKRLDADLPVLLMTAWTSLETAVQLVKEGAADYLGKPWDDAKVVTTVKNMLRMRELGLENHRLRAQSARARNELQRHYDLCGLVYASEAMHRVVSLATSVARADAPVLITGPNGSGKEKLAEIVHANSPRKLQPFVKVNAGGLPDELLEAELFGAEIGAFTGATKRRIGRFEAADGGTLFLDEIGNLSPKGQMKLLRVLQTGEFERLGSTSTKKVDVRIVSATNANLRQMIAQGVFREDLLFRLNVIEIRIPPLRERSEDVLPLAETFLQAQVTPGREPLRLGDEAMRALLGHDWPGNVRELQNRIQRATLLCQSGEVTPADLGLDDKAPATDGTVTPRNHPSSDAKPAAVGNNEEIEAERRSIIAAIETHGGVIARAAAELGLSRQALYRRMDRLGISLERQLKQS